jgi:hypothetical protein
MPQERRPSLGFSCVFLFLTRVRGSFPASLPGLSFPSFFSPAAKDYLLCLPSVMSILGI